MAGQAGNTPSEGCSEPLRLTDLPDECLVQIFGQLSIKERCRSVAPVCQHWRALCASPDLLRTVDISAWLNHDGHRHYSAALPHCMRSLFPWLHRHAAPHVQRLSLSLQAPYRRNDYDSLQDQPGLLAEEQAVMAELPQALLGLLATACAAGRLHELSLDIGNMQVHLGPWLLPAASTLRSLRVHQDCVDLAVPAAAGLHGLTALQELSLSVEAGDLLFEPGCRLPSQSLTLLELNVNNCSSDPWLPAQELSALSALHTLHLYGPFATSSFEVLAGLPSLRCLRMHDCLALPRCLSELTRLSELSVCQDLSHLRQTAAQQQQADESLPFLSEGVAELCHLTSLQLRVSDSLSISTLPADLGDSLPLLRRFAWIGKAEDEGQLPSGMAHLRAAALPSAVAERSMARLAAGARLEQLGLYDADFYSSGQPPPGERRQQLHALALRVVRQLPSLRRLELTLAGQELEYASAAAKGVAPALNLDRFCLSYWWD
ncbi:hypothetical protein ABPG75_007053 [Micractinium tetrahymenae]